MTRSYFVSPGVTMAGAWVHYYGPQTKFQPIEWRHSGSPSSKKFRVQKFVGKVLAAFFLVLSKSNHD